MKRATWPSTLSTGGERRSRFALAALVALAISVAPRVAGATQPCEPGETSGALYAFIALGVCSILAIAACGMCIWHGVKARGGVRVLLVLVGVGLLGLLFALGLLLFALLLTSCF